MPFVQNIVAHKSVSVIGFEKHPGKPEPLN